MENSIKNITEKEAIATWEDEGGALKPIQVVKKKSYSWLIFLSFLVGLPVIYWLTKKS